MRLTAPAWAKTLLTVLLLVHLLIHPTLHMLVPVGDGVQALNAPTGTQDGGAPGEGRAPCLACRIGSSILVSAVAAEPLPLNLVNERPSVVDVFVPICVAGSSIPSRAPPLAT